MGYDALLVPFGVLEIGRGAQAINQLWIGLGQSRETSDFIADALDRWWEQRRDFHSGIQRIQINLDNGPEISSSRTQFMNRLVQFADRTGLDIELVYYPPYHSKYNPIERCWGILESHWNGAILSSVEVAMNWAATMTWRGPDRRVDRRRLRTRRHHHAFSLSSNSRPSRQSEDSEQMVCPHTSPAG